MNEELPPTEERNPRTADLDLLPAEAVADLFAAEAARAAEAVRGARAEVARAIEMAAAALGSGGRIAFAGAGTSGRLGAMEAAECPPTFGTDPSRVLALVAGGERALARSVEGAEDRAEDGAAAAAGLGRGDALFGIAASRTTPFVRGALEAARRAGAATALVTCNPPPEGGSPPADLVVCLRTGPEALTGSTRLKAATATKVALNAITTGAMVRLGKVYSNFMVDLMATNAKLRARARRIVREVSGCPDGEAAAHLDRAGGSVKEAILAARLGLAPEEARRRLAASGGRLRDCLEGREA